MNTAVIIVVVVIVSLVAYLFYSYKKLTKGPLVENHPGIVVLNDSNFSAEIKKGLILVDFWADWCMPCKIIAPTLNEIANEMEGKVRIGKLNIEQFPTPANKFQVRSIPTLILFKNGVEVNRIVGVKPKAILKREIEKYL